MPGAARPGILSRSAQLTNTAEQAGLATSQIATTVQQVARGNAQQTESVTRTVTSVEQMSRLTEGVALAEVAEALQQVVSQFKLSTDGGVDQEQVQEVKPASQHRQLKGLGGNGHHPQGAFGHLAVPVETKSKPSVAG